MSDAWPPSASGKADGGLRRQVARGLTWTIANTWGEQMLNLLVFVVLARKLTDVDLGLVGLAAVFVAFAQLFVDQGTGDALIARRDLTRTHIDTAFWTAMATGTALTAAGMLLAGPIALVVRTPELEPILRVLSLSFILTALSSIQIALLRRELAFRSLALRAIAAAIGGGLIGIGLAFMNAGAWALVGQQLGAAAVSVIALWTVSPWRPRLRVSRTHFRELFGFGINVVGSDVLSFVSRYSDNFLIGVVLGPGPLGLYSVAYRILNASQVVLINVSRRIAFPAFARLRGDRDRMRTAYFRLSRVAGLAILPGYIGLALVAPELTVVVFGAKWAASGVVAAMLFFIGPVLTIQAFSSSLLYAAGHPEVVFRFRLATAITNVIGFIIAVPFGIVAVAAAFVVRGFLLLPLNLYWMRKYAGIAAGDYLRQLTSLAIATLAMSATVLLVKLSLATHVGNLWLLIVETIVGAATVLVVLWMMDRGLLREVGEVARHAIPGADRALRRFRAGSAADEGAAD
ncbi:MAG TPA: lipopolysaccharide biosynthesis protein [Candidatus Limnocylindria bacterium]|jgi:PST family polysaccharide transporter|nr:lipopolysaccharide biosynthesis protein [Candidatus Limnocylindria bacterium]